MNRINTTYNNYSSTQNTCAGAYLSGFNGMEHEDEVAPGMYTAEYWEYDSRIGRRWNTDPVVYPWQSSYACFNNNPIYYKDPSGLEPTNDDKNKPTGTGTKDDPIYTKGNITDGAQQIDEIVITAKAPTVQSPASSTANTYNVTPQNSTGNSPNKRSDVSRDLANAFRSIGVNLRRLDNYFDKYQTKMPDEYDKAVQTSNGGYMNWGNGPNKGLHFMSDDNRVEMTDGSNPGALLLGVAKPDVFKDYVSEFIHGNLNKSDAWQKMAESIESIYDNYQKQNKYQPVLQQTNSNKVIDTVYKKVNEAFSKSYFVRGIIRENGDSVDKVDYQPLEKLNK